MPDTSPPVRRSLSLPAPIRRRPRTMLEQTPALVGDDAPAAWRRASIAATATGPGRQR
ncbi:hypothetical protein [Nonomuraea indica]|uniref:Uncharacterized protein n=1 Tax=Nonomuraea indica TaxID=1581193 RepID=A0ABW7ZZU5_9ACTN